MYVRLDGEMRASTKAVSLVAMLVILSTASMVFASGIFDASRPLLFGAPIQPMQGGTPNVFVDPPTISKDYVRDPGYQIGDLLQVNVNITDVTDLFSYQVNVTWSAVRTLDSGMLNFTRIVSYGDFLARTGSSYGTSRIAPTWTASNETGFVSVAETILGDVGGITGSGRLFTLEFEVVGYGSARIDVSVGGRLPTKLLSSMGGEMVFTSASCYFSNMIPGDLDADHDVDGVDFGIFAPNYGKSGQPPVPIVIPPPQGDLDWDGDVDGVDFGIFAPNYGRSF